MEAIKVTHTLNTIRRTLITLLLLVAAAGALLLPGEVAAAARASAGLALFSVLPTLFPFLVLADLLVSMGIADRLGRAIGGLMPRLFRLPGAAASVLVLGVLSGYPVGAAAATRLYESGGCNREQAGRLIALANNTGPAFVVGVVGATLWGSAGIGWWMYGIHLAAALLSGFVLARRAPAVRGSGQRPVKRPPALSSAVTKSVKQAAATCLNIAAFITFFGVLIALLRQTGLLRALAMLLPGSPAAWEPLLAGVIEMTTGVSLLSELAAPAWVGLVLQSALLGFAGVSVLFQVHSVMDHTDLSLRPYVTGKLLQGVIAAGLTWSLYPRFPAPVAAMASAMPVEMTFKAFLMLVALTAASFALSVAIVFLFAWISERYGWPEAYEHSDPTLYQYPPWGY